MGINRKIAKSLDRLIFEHREADFQHHTYADDLHQYELIKRGDPRAIDIGRKMFEGPNTGSLSEDPLKNYQYLFIASITLAGEYEAMLLCNILCDCLPRITFND